MAESSSSRGRKMLRESGYRHPDEAEDKSLIKSMVKPNALKRKSGGSIPGGKPKTRPDRHSRGAKTVVNVITGGNSQQARQEGVQQGLKAGAAMGAQAAAQKLGGSQGMTGMPAGGPSPGGPMPSPMPPGPMGRAKGGAVVTDASGQPPINVRAEKFSGQDEQHMPPFPKQDQPIQVKAHERRRSGGRVSQD